ncbi:MAG: VacJ family lipoprotein [Herbaspirillum sp.]
MIGKIQSGKFGALALSLLLLAGCAGSGGHDPRDPFENFNRSMFTFNDAVDRAALKPVATVYRDATPSFVQTGIGNFFGNIGDVWSTVNSFLQGKLERGVTGVMRVAVNTVLGLGGVLDISSEAGLTRHQSDFGQTLGTWGVQSGPYMVLPLLGSSTVRDTAGLPLDIYGNLWTYKTPVLWRNVGAGVRVIDKRASLLDASELIDNAALDRYQFVRDAYLQRRAGQISDQDSDWSDPVGGSEPAADPVVPMEPALPAAVQPESTGNK